MDHYEDWARKAQQTLLYSGLEGNDDLNKTRFSSLLSSPLLNDIFSSPAGAPDSMQTPPPSRHLAQRPCLPLLVCVWGGCLVHYVILSSFPGLYLLDVGSSPLDVKNKIVSRCYPVCPLFTLVENYSVVVSFYCCNKLPPTSWHKTTLTYPLTALWVRCLGWGASVLCSESYWTEIKVSPGTAVLTGVLGQ